MKRSHLYTGFLFICLVTICGPKLYAQNSTASVEKPQKSVGTGLFDSEQVLEMTLSGTFRKLLNDRSEKPVYYPMVVSYKAGDSTTITLPAKAKTRGHFRRLKENCSYPPLALNFYKSDVLNTSVFKKQEKLKLVMPCRGDEYVIREWLVYKLYNLVSEKSFKTRLVRIQLDDSSSKKQAAPFYGILLEDEDQLAKRNNAVSVKRKLQPEQTDPDAFITMAVFQYLVGNTDWSIQYMQNIKLLADDSAALVTTVVPYDFDHAGLVDAPYARPAEELEMQSIRQRRYRGYCIKDMKQYDEVIALYNRLKNDIYATYTSCSLLPEKYVKATTKYLDEFYATINDPREVARQFGYPCDDNNTGNVVIKGLKEQEE